MDPDVLLERLLDLARAVHDPRRAIPDGSAEMLAELVCDLDTWLAHGGFPPRRWRPRREGLPTDEQALRVAALMRERRCATAVLTAGPRELPGGWLTAVLEPRGGWPLRVDISPAGEERS